MRLKIRCDGKSEKFCKIFWELNKALVEDDTFLAYKVAEQFFKVVQRNVLK